MGTGQVALARWTMLPLIERLNNARHEHPALSELSNVTVLDMANRALLGDAKQSRAISVFTVVNGDPHLTREGMAIVAARLGLPLSFRVHDVVFDECLEPSS
jgi:hypothetical protein